MSGPSRRLGRGPRGGSEPVTVANSDDTPDVPGAATDVGLPSADLEHGVEASDVMTPENGSVESDADTNVHTDVDVDTVLPFAESSEAIDTDGEQASVPIDDVTIEALADAPANGETVVDDDAAAPVATATDLTQLDASDDTSEQNGVEPEVGTGGPGGPDDPGPGEEALAPEPKRRRGFLTGKVGAIVAGVAAAAVILVGAIVIGSSDGKSSSGSQASGSTTTNGKCAQYDPLSAMHALNRPDNPTSLGTTDNLQSWTTQNATFGLAGKEAFVAARTAGGPAQAVVKMDAGDGTVCAAIPVVRANSGLIFRWQDPNNYWRITAVPKVATWNITRVQNGVPTIIANTGVSASTNGTVVSVRLLGADIRVYLNGKLAKTVSSPTMAGARYAGIIAAGLSADSSKSRWAGFIADSFTAADAKKAQGTSGGGTAGPSTTAGK